jgi:hypothetical protein
MSFANVPVTMINAVDTVTQTGPPVFTGQIFAGSFTMTFGDTSVAGSVQIQGSNETASRSNLSTYVPSSGSWNNIPGASSTIAAGVGPAIVLPTLNFQYIRAVFTYVSGGSSTVQVLGNLFST